MALTDFKVAKKPHDGLPLDTIVKRDPDQVAVLVTEGYLVPVAQPTTQPQQVAPPPAKPQTKE